MRKLERVSLSEGKARRKALAMLAEVRRGSAGGLVRGEDVAVVERCLLEYVDALDFMCTMFRRLQDMVRTGAWEAHSEMVSRAVVGALTVEREEEEEEEEEAEE